MRDSNLNAERTSPIAKPKITLADIDALVSARLGPARVRGNAQPAVFYRQIAMYVAKKVGWSTSAIGRFYNGRDHSTVCHAIHKIEAMRLRQSEVEELLEYLIDTLQQAEPPRLGFVNILQTDIGPNARCLPDFDEAMLDALADRIADRLISRRRVPMQD